MLRTTLCWIRSFLFSIPLIILFTTTLGTIGVLGSLVDARGRILGKCRKLWARLTLAVSFVRFRTTRLDKIDPSQAYVFCANHRSYLDPPVILSALEMPVCFLAKKSLFRIPILGWAMQKGGDVPIDRENPRRAARSLRIARERVRQGTSIIVFPEGTRSRDGELQPFLTGAFRLAVETQAPVVPLAISGTREALAPGSLNFRGGHVHLSFGAPISTLEMAKQDKDRLAKQIQQTIQELLEEVPPAAVIE